VGIQIGVGRGVSKDPILAAQQAVDQVIQNGDEPKLCILLPASSLSNTF
jgi:hypothetical protein